MSLKIVHKNTKVIKRERNTDPQLLDAEVQMMNDIKETFKKMMEKKFAFMLKDPQP